VQNVLEPTITRVHSQKDEINQIWRRIKELGATLKEIDYAVFKKGEQTSAFDDVYERINELERVRVTEGARLESDFAQMSK